MTSLLSFLSSMLIITYIPKLTLSQLPPGPSPPIAPIARLPPRAPPGPSPPIAPIARIPSPQQPQQWPQTPQQPGGGIPVIMTLPTRPPVAGFWGQDCTPSQGDYPEQCPNPADEKFAPLGKIECIHNFDCCTCKAMICGDAAIPCTDLICNGDSSCYGVRDVRLTGGDAGVNINCNGDISCQKTGIVATNVASILCSGDNSCSFSIFNLVCLLSGCILECVGDSSCEADPTSATLVAIYTIDNSYGMSCSARACKYATFNLLSNIGGSIICGAHEACLGSKITIDRDIGGIMCGGRHSCKDANILLFNPSKDFSLFCQSADSCLNLKLEIVITDPLIDTFSGITCGAMNACENARIIITKQIAGATTSGGSPSLKIAELGCGGYRACYNTQFLLTNVVFEHCGCAGGMTQACDGLSGIESCAQGLTKIECVGISCQGMTEEIVNPKDYFELSCNDPNSCRGYTLTIKINDAANAPNILGGIICGATNACVDMRINIINTKRNGASSPILIQNGVLCGTTNSCQNAIIVTHNANIPSIGCGDTTSCVGCQQWTNMQYNPC